MDEKKTIAICSAGELFGGVEQWVVSFVQYACRHCDRVQFVVILFWDGKLAERLRAIGVEPIIVKTKGTYDLSVFKQLSRVFKENNVGLVHTHGFKADVLCGVAALRSNIPLIKTQHGAVEAKDAFSLSALKMRMNIVLSRCMEPFFSTIVFVTQDLLDKRLIKSKKMVVIYNGIEEIGTEIAGHEDRDDILPMRQNGSTDAVKKRTFSHRVGEGTASMGREISFEPKEAFKIGIIGRLARVKGHKYLIKAIKNLADAVPAGRQECHAYFFGSGALLGELLQCAYHNNVVDRVHFMGFRTDIHACMRGLDVFAMPSLHEGLPYTLLDAMYLRVPIVAAKVGGLAEILNDGKDALFFSSRDVAELTYAIKHLYDDREAGQHMAKNAYDTVVRKFMIGTMVERYVEEYSKIGVRGAINN